MKLYKSVLILTALVTLAVLVGSATAEEYTENVNISVTSPNTLSDPFVFAIPEDTTSLVLSGDTSGVQIDVHLYDPSDEHTGATYPSGEETNIPDSTYSGWSSDPEVITVSNPAAGDYEVKAYGYYTTGWTNVTITWIVVTPGELSYISGQVQGQMRDGTFLPLEDVDITVRYSLTGDLYNEFPAETDANGDFLIGVEPNTEFDLTFSKENFVDYSEERVKSLGTDETKDLGVVYLTEKEEITKYLEVTVNPSQVCNDTDSSVTATVTNNTGAPVEVATVTLSGCGVSDSGTTNADGEVSFTIHPTVAPCDITVTATKAGYVSDTTTIDVIICEERYGTLIVDVMDRATGKNVGTFSVPDTDGGGPWPVPEVMVTAWDSTTKEKLAEDMTVNGVAALIIPIPTGDDIVVDVNNTEVEADSNTTHCFPGVTKGSEMGTTVIVDTTKPVTLEVTVINPPKPTGPKYLEIEDVTPGTVEICEDTEVTITVTDKDTSEALEGATVTLSGCSVSESGTTNEDGEVSFTIHPKSSGGAITDITVTASKSGYISGTATITVNDRAILLVNVYDASNSTKIPEDATVELINQMADWSLTKGVIDGTATFNASDIDCTEDWYTIYAYASDYREYIEHGIWLPVEGYKIKEAPLTPTK